MGCCDQRPHLGTMRPQRGPSTPSPQIPGAMMLTNRGVVVRNSRTQSTIAPADLGHLLSRQDPRGCATVLNRPAPKFLVSIPRGTRYQEARISRFCCVLPAFVSLAHANDRQSDPAISTSFQRPLRTSSAQNVSIAVRICCRYEACSETVVRNNLF
jgi:hypothetical protein